MLSADSDRVHLRFVSGRPVSQGTIDLSFVAVQTGSGAGQRRTVAHLGSRAGYLPRVAFINKIEPKCVHSKRAIVEPARLLTAQELKQHVCDYFDCELLEPLTQQVT
jgi:hypothetical protein